MRLMIAAAASLLLIAPSAYAQIDGASLDLFSAPRAHGPWRLERSSMGDEAVPAVPAMSLPISAALYDQDATQPLHAAAIEHSEAYQKRAKLHKYASFATLPLFATELALGQSVYSSTGDAGGKKGAHVVVGTGIVALFGVNTVTGLWNMFGKEGRQDTDGRTLRLAHGLLMMAADTGFLATAVLTPEGNDHGRTATATNGRSRHRGLAIGSISVGTAGYLLMLLGNR